MNEISKELREVNKFTNITDILSFFDFAQNDRMN